MNHQFARSGDDRDAHSAAGNETIPRSDGAGDDDDEGGVSPVDGPHPVLVEHLIEADEQRRRLRRSGQADLSTIQFSDELTPGERDEISRMLQCADELERLAAVDTDRSSIEPATEKQPASEQQPATDSGAAGIPEDHRIGPYRVLRLIADGGFGAVLLAVDERNERRVALKVPRPDILLTSRLQERFLIEGRAAATLNHPNIVSVFEILSEPVPAIAFEYCEGGTLSRAADRITDERTAIQIVLRLAEALQHAHTRGILHRDVKPGNVLLVHADAAASEHAVEIDGEWWIPKLGDFGLAKLLDESVHQTQSGMVIGTPQFMAPEQAAGRVSELGTHTDVFSLGAIFYWLLVGHPPFEGHGTLQTLKLVETADVQPPRQLRRDLSPRTQAVCLKCLRRPIDARYASAAALADDLRHLLQGEPVSVRPPSIVERLRQWRRRNPALTALAIVLPLAAVAGLLMQWNNNRSLQNYIERLDAANRDLLETTQQAEDARRLAERRGYASDLQLAQRGFESGDLMTYREALARYIPASAQEFDLRGPEWQELWNRGHPPGTPIDEFPSAVYCANLSSDGAYLAAAGADATVRIYETATWQRVALIPTGQQEVNYAAFSSDGSRIASAGDDGTIKIWDWREGTEQLSIEAYDTLVYCVQFYADDSRIASCARHEIVRLWDADSGKLEAELQGDGSVGRFEQLDVSDDGRWLAAAAFDGRRRVWDLQTRKRVESLPPVDDQQVSSICFFERNAQPWLVSGTLRDGSRVECSVILEAVGEEDQRTLPVHFDGIHSVTVNRAGTLALAGDRSGRVSLIDVNAAIRGKRWWNPQTVRKVWVGHAERVYGLAIIDDKTAITGGEDGGLIRWDIDEMVDSSTLSAPRGDNLEWKHAAVGPGGSIYVLDGNYRLHRWSPQADLLTVITDADTGRPLELDPCRDRASGSVVVRNDRIYAGTLGGPVGCWRIDGARAQRVWSASIGETTDGDPADSLELALSADGNQLAVCRRGHPVHNIVIDARSGDVLQEIPVEGGVAVVCRAISFDSTGRRLAFGNEEDVFVCDLQTGQQTRFSHHSDEIYCVCFVPGTSLLVSGAADRRICVWDLTDGQLAHELTGHRGTIACLGLHPHPDRLISADDTGWVRIWSLREGMLLSELPPPSSRTWPVACGADIVGISEETTVFRKPLPSPR